MPAATPLERPSPPWAESLARRPTREEVRRYRAQARARFPALRWSAWNVVTSVVTVATIAVIGSLVVVFGLFFALLAVAAMLGWMSGVDSWVRLLAAPLLVLDIAGAVVFGRFLLDVARRDARFGIRWRRAARLHRFAEANGLDYLPQVADPPPIGLLFTAGTRRLVRDLVTGDEGVPFELGNYQYAGRSHERSLRRFGFLHLELPRLLPHMVLLARRSPRQRRRATLPWRIPRDQVVPLGEPFDSHFTLHCPVHYADDARYVFTPKLMAVLVEHARDFDVEIVDSRILLSRSTPLDMTAQATYELLGGLIGSIGTVTSARSKLYSDPRALPYRIGPAGHRLRLAVPRLSVVVGVLAGAWLVARIVTALLGIGI